MKILAKIIAGRINDTARMALANYIRTVQNGEVIIEIKAPMKPRSNQENAYYWCVCVGIIADHCGYTPQECHDALRAMFLVVEGKLPRIRSTTELNTVEFEEYLSKIRKFAAETLSSPEGTCYIPLPGESVCELLY